MLSAENLEGAIQFRQKMPDKIDLEKLEVGSAIDLKRHKRNENFGYTFISTVPCILLEGICGDFSVQTP